MRNTIVLEVASVFLTDFDDKLTAPEFIESKEGGVRVLFNGLDELKDYQKYILSDHDETSESFQRNEVRSKLNLAINQALLDNQVVLDAIKTFADVLFSFVFNAEAHKQDKIVIFNTLIEGVRETTNSWELEESIKESTYELGTLTFNHKLTFYNFAHNQVDFNYEKIKNRLIKELLILKLGLD